MYLLIIHYQYMVSNNSEFIGGKCKIEMLLLLLLLCFI